MEELPELITKIFIQNDLIIARAKIRVIFKYERD